MRLGFLAHASELNGAKNDVLSNASPLNWALFGLAMSGGGVESAELCVLETGAGGLEELESNLEPGRIAFALARVLDDNTRLPKVVFISWVRVEIVDVYVEVKGYGCHTSMLSDAVSSCLMSAVSGRRSAAAQARVQRALGRRAAVSAGLLSRGSAGAARGRRAPGSHSPEGARCEWRQVRGASRRDREQVLWYAVSSVSSV